MYNDFLSGIIFHYFRHAVRYSTTKVLVLKKSKRIFNIKAVKIQ